jgi:hypothetical protein
VPVFGKRHFLDCRQTGNYPETGKHPGFCLQPSRHIITNPGSMSDIAISKCLRVHRLYVAFRVGLAVVQYPQTMLRADFLEDWP